MASFQCQCNNNPSNNACENQLQQTQFPNVFTPLLQQLFVLNQQPTVARSYTFGYGNGSATCDCPTEFLPVVEPVVPTINDMEIAETTKPVATSGGAFDRVRYLYEFDRMFEQLRDRNVSMHSNASLQGMDVARMTELFGVIDKYFKQEAFSPQYNFEVCRNLETGFYFKDYGTPSNPNPVVFSKEELDHGWYPRNHIHRYDFYRAMYMIHWNAMSDNTRTILNKELASKYKKLKSPNQSMEEFTNEVITASVMFNLTMFETAYVLFDTGYGYLSQTYATMRSLADKQQILADFVKSRDITGIVEAIELNPHDIAEYNVYDHKAEDDEHTTLYVRKDIDTGVLLDYPNTPTLFGRNLVLYFLNGMVYILPHANSKSRKSAGTEKITKEIQQEDGSVSMVEIEKQILKNYEDQTVELNALFALLHENGIRFTLLGDLNHQYTPPVHSALYVFPTDPNMPTVDKIRSIMQSQANKARKRAKETRDFAISNTQYIQNAEVFTFGNQGTLTETHPFDHAFLQGKIEQF